MEKEARKRPASRIDEEAEVRRARATTLDDDVEKFFAIIRRIRGTSLLSGKADCNHRNPSFQLEDFGVFEGGQRGGSGRREGQSTSGREEEEEEEGEAGLDNGVPAWLSLNVGSCGGGRQLLVTGDESH